MKNIVIVNSTYRKGGNSELLAQAFAKGAQEAGNAVQTISIREMQLKFCIGCLSCQKTGKCVLQDDINAILPVVQQADVLVFATPVYYYSMSGQLKTFLDRMNPLYVQSNRFRKIYVLATAAENDTHAMQGTVQGIQGWADCFDGVEIADVVYGIGVEGVGEVEKTAAFDQAYRMGKSIR